MKTCSKCKVEKPLDEYFKRSLSKDGLNSRCKTCDMARSKEYKNKNPERTRAYRLKWISENPDAPREYLARKNYGLTLEQYDAIVNIDRCEACGTTDPKQKHGKFVLDHCHTTDRVRGALCNPCNVSLGYMNDDPERIEGLLAYARRHHAITLAS